MILQAIEEQCLEEMLIIAAALSVQDPRDRPMERQEAADQAHGKYRDETSDFLSFLRLWNFLRRKEQELSSRQFRKFCRENFLSFIRVREWQDVHAQLAQQVRELGGATTNTQSIGKIRLCVSTIVSKGCGDEATCPFNRPLTG